MLRYGSRKDEDGRTLRELLLLQKTEQGKKDGRGLRLIKSGPGASEKGFDEPTDRLGRDGRESEREKEREERREEAWGEIGCKRVNGGSVWLLARSVAVSVCFFNPCRLSNTKPTPVNVKFPTFLLFAVICLRNTCDLACARMPQSYEW